MCFKKIAILVFVVLFTGLTACANEKSNVARSSTEDIEPTTTTTTTAPTTPQTMTENTTTTASSTTTTTSNTPTTTSNTTTTTSNTPTETTTSTVATTTTSKPPETSAAHRYYVLNHNSGILHSPTCYTLEDNSPDYEDVIDVSQEWLNANGYRVCKKCNPFVPDKSDNTETVTQIKQTETTETTTLETATTTAAAIQTTEIVITEPPGGDAQGNVTDILPTVIELPIIPV